MSTDELASETPPSPSADEQNGSKLPAAVEWVLGVLVALGGVLALGIGTALGTAVDRETVTDAIEDGDVVAGTEELTAAEGTEVVDTLVSWVEIGFFVVGAGMIVAAVGYLYVRRQARQQARAGQQPDAFGTHALLGAVIGAVLSFIPLATGLGGAVAGYFERSDSSSGHPTRAGAVSGLLLVMPVLVLLAFMFAGLVSGLQAVGQGDAVGVSVVLGLLTGAISAAITAGVGALGGFVGGRVADD